MKVLTTLAAVDVLGADHRFTTSVVASGKAKIVLVGGGDPLLTDKQSRSAAKPASLEALAKATAASLTASGVKRVTLGYDASEFSGPDFSPDWLTKWRSWVSRVSSLLVDGGRFNQWQSDPKPALTAAKAFAARLKKAGIKVTSPTPAKAPAGASEVASVTSAPLSEIVAHTLRLSDNLAADVLARHVAVATGGKGSFEGATQALKAWLVGHELWAQGMSLKDGSGLSPKARVTPEVLARAIVTSLNTESLRAVAAGLPVAGKNGTLKDRFDDKSERVARGNVHAKTGTLVGVATLAGYLTTKDGAQLVFAAMANGTSGQTYRVQLARPLSGRPRALRLQLRVSGAGRRVAHMEQLPVVDWTFAARAGRALVPPGPELSEREIASLVADLRDAAGRATGHVAEVTRLRPPAPAEVLIVDRGSWIAALAQSADSLLTGAAATQAGLPSGWATVKARALGAQAAPVFAAIATRVLGQFDPFVSPARLLLVAPNIIAVERELGARPADFRLWVCLHEETHRFQFGHAPWLREHVLGMVARVAGR